VGVLVQGRECAFSACSYFYFDMGYLSQPGNVLLVFSVRVCAAGCDSGVVGEGSHEDDCLGERRGGGSCWVFF